MSLAANLTCAEAGIDYIKQHFPFGGLNREDVFREKLGSDPQHEQLRLFEKYRRSPFINEKISAQELFDLKGGFCGEHMFITGAYLQAAFPKIKVEPVGLVDHAMLVIGRAADSNPKDIKTWGDDAAICDPWAQLYYPVTEFFARQQGPDIKIYGNFLLKSRGQHYLAGNPLVWCQLSDSQMFPFLKEHISIGLKARASVESLSSLASDDTDVATIQASMSPLQTPPSPAQSLIDSVDEGCAGLSPAGFLLPQSEDAVPVETVTTFHAFQASLTMEAAVPIIEASI